MVRYRVVNLHLYRSEINQSTQGQGAIREHSESAQRALREHLESTQSIQIRFIQSEPLNTVSCLETDYKRKVTNPVIALMEKVCGERGLTLLQLTGAILK